MSGMSVQYGPRSIDSLQSEKSCETGSGKYGIDVMCSIARVRCLRPSHAGFKGVPTL